MGVEDPRVAAALALLHDDTDVTKVLDLARVPLCDGAALALAEAIESKAGTLAAINLQNSGLKAAGCRAVCEAASKCEVLCELRVCGNDIGDEGGTGLADTLATNTTLAKLELRYCNLGPSGCAAIFSAIGSSYSLEELNLSGNPLSDSAARCLASSLSVTISLTRLNLADTDLQPAACKEVCAAAKKSPLRELLLPFNSVSNEMAGFLSDYLRESSKLTTLNLHSCGIDAEGVAAIADGIRKGPIRKGPLKLIGVDLSTVADELHLPEKDGVIWDHDSILELFRQQIEDREHGVPAGRPSTRSSRPSTQGSAGTGTNGSTNEGDDDEEAQPPHQQDQSHLAIPKALDRLRAKDKSFTKLHINRTATMIASLFERASTIASKAEGEAARAHIMDREPLLVVAKEKKKAMFKAEANLEAVCLKLGELRALGAALDVTTILTELKLFDCGIRASGCKTLCLGDKNQKRVGLINCVSLKEIDLSFNLLEDDGGEHVAHVLGSKNCSALGTVKLNRCGIRERGTLALAKGARKGPLRAHPLILFGVTLSIVVPQLHLPELAGGWNTQSILAFFHHENGGVVGDEPFKPIAVIGRTKEELEAEAMATAEILCAQQEASRNAFLVYLAADKKLAEEQQKGKEQAMAANQEALAAAAATVEAASVLLTPDLIKEFNKWDAAFERDFLEREKKTYRQWQDSIIDIDRVIP